MVKFNSFLLKFQALVTCFYISCLFSCINDHSTRHDVSVAPSEHEYYDGKGTGPVKNISIDVDMDSSMAANGELLFKSKCVTCHQISEKKLIGPGLKGITKRRRAEWIMNQILDPLEMTKSDSMSKELLSVYLTQMTNMNLTQDQARCVLEYFRKMDE